MLKRQMAPIRAERRAEVDERRGIYLFAPRRFNFRSTPLFGSRTLAAFAPHELPTILRLVPCRRPSGPVRKRCIVHVIFRGCFLSDWQFGRILTRLL